MCIAPGSRLFVRRDSDMMLQGILPDLNKTKISPAMHMNFNGELSYTGSGFLSLFLYDPKQSYPLDGRNFKQSAYLAMNNLPGEYIHCLFIPNTVHETSLTDKTVYSMPDTGRTPTLFNSEKCNPPARINMETNEVLEYANRYICEYLYAGAWAQGIKVVTERARASLVMYLMERATSTEEICKQVDKLWPCDPSGFGGGDGSFGGGKAMVN